MTEINASDRKQNILNEIEARDDYR